MKLVTGYAIEEVEDVEPYNAQLKDDFGSDVPVTLEVRFHSETGAVEYIPQSPRWNFGAFNSPKEAYREVSSFLRTKS